MCGPIDPETWDGNRYFLTSLDNYTHFLVVYLLKRKSEVFDCLRQYVEEVEAKWNLEVSKIRSDNGKEYVNNNMENYVKEKGLYSTTRFHTRRR